MNTKAYNAEYYAANRERLLAAKNKYQAENREKINATARGNRPARTAYRRQYLRDNPGAKAAAYMRTRIYIALKGAAKASNTFGLLGCQKSEYLAHLEAQFRPGMTWENYGPVWHVDHIKPCVSFDLTDSAQQRECFHYTNLQPLFAEENLQKAR